MKTQKLLEKARIGLILNEPFFASASLRMGYKENTYISTGRTNGLDIEYNPTFFEQLSFEERKGFIAHEIAHIFSMHHIRATGKNPKVWNIACDYAINPLLKNAGITLPKGACINYKFDGMSAEEIYNILMQDNGEDQQQGNSNSSGGSGSDQDDSNGFGGVTFPPPSEDLKQLEQEAKQMALEACNAAKQAGKLPSNFSELIETLVEAKYDWKELLIRFVSEVVKNDYTWAQPNSRYLPSGLYLPKLESTEIGKVVFAIDTSGSVDRELLSEFISEIKEAMSIFSIPVTVIHCDTKVQKVEELTEDDNIVPVGRGGTNFQPVFDYVNENLDDAKAIVYFTDGDAFDEFKEPSVPVLWAIYNNRHFKCDFGEIIIVENK